MILNQKIYFSTESSKKDNIIFVSFYVTTMSLEILMNQPFKKKIKILHNNVLKPFMKKTNQKVERIENNTVWLLFNYNFKKTLY